MDIETKNQGTVTISDKQKIRVAEGLYGFEDYHDYALIDSRCPPYFWLQSLEEKALAFLVVDPFLIRSDYEADIDDDALASVGIRSPAEVLVLAILTVPEDGAAPTVNLRGPLIVNKRTGACFQAVLTDKRWTTRHGVTPAAVDKGGPSC
jgi:flagellar assembly factor FliW